MEPLANLVVDRASKDEVLLSLNLTNMTYLEDLVWLVDLVICLHPEMMRTHSKLAQRNIKGMCPMMECVMGPDNEIVTQIHEMCNIEGHLWT